MRPARAALALLGAACAEPGLRLELPPESAGGSIVLIHGTLGFAADVETQTELESFPAEDRELELLVYRDRIAALQLEVDADFKIRTGTARPLPAARAQLRGGDPWTPVDDPSVRERVRLPPFDFARCAEGCIDREHPGACLLPCEAPRAPVPPAPPAPPAAPATPALSPCLASMSEVERAPGLFDCERRALLACTGGRYRPYDSPVCVELDPCPSTDFATEAALLYVSVGGRGDGRSPSAPLGSLDAALSLAAPGDTIALGGGVHALSAPIAGVSVVGLCSARTSLSGSVRLGARALLRGVSASAVEVDAGAVGVRLERASIRATAGDALRVGGGASVSAGELALGAPGGAAIRVSGATLALSRWSVDGAFVAIDADDASLTLERGVVDRATRGLDLAGGRATISGLEVGTSASGREPFALQASQGAQVLAEDVWTAGFVLGRQAGTTVELRRARTFGLNVYEARVRGADLRIIDDVVFLDHGAEVELSDVLRARMDPLRPLGDDVKDGAGLRLSRAILVSAPQLVEQSASATIADVTMRCADGRNGLATSGPFDARRIALEGCNIGLVLNGRSLVEDVRIERTGKGIDTGPVSVVHISRYVARELASSALDAKAHLVLEDLDAEGTNADTPEFPVISVNHGATIRRARVGAGGYDYAVRAWPAFETAAIEAELSLEDAELACGRLGAVALAGTRGASLARVRVRGDGPEALLLESAAATSLRELDLELSARAPWGLRSDGATRVSLEGFRVIGGTGGVSLGPDVEASLIEGVLAEQAGAALSLPSALDPWAVLHRVRVLGAVAFE